MKVKLTGTKSIEVGFPGRGKNGGSACSGLSDVTGVELDWTDKRGCPAVRLVHKKGEWIVAAAGFVPPPESRLPTTWDEARHQPEWSLPQEFQAPHAALVVDSCQGIVRQTSPDAVLADLDSPVKAEDVSSKKLAVRHEKKDGNVAVKPGEPVSVNGMRFVTARLAEEPFILQSALPEFQALWLSRLLPEGRRPTAMSIQMRQTALLASLCEQPEFAMNDGTALAVYVLRDTVFLAGYQNGNLLLFRQCPGVAGWEALRKGVRLRLGLDEEMVDEILDDAIVDPRETMEPFVRPVLQQMEMSLDYLSNRHHLNVDRVFLMGMPSGARYWNQISEEQVRRTLISPSAFSGLTPSPKIRKAIDELTASRSQIFLAACGAARAAMEAS